MISKAPRVGLVTLGCPKNLVDSELMIGSLVKEGYTLAPSVEECDVALINTCAFIDASKKESIDQILDLAALKTSGKIQGLVVMGCLSQKYGEEVRREIPEIDAFIGTGDLEKIVPTVKSILKRKEAQETKTIYEVGDPSYLYDDKSPRFQLTLPHTRYIKVSEGCNHTCSFCVIPQLRGSHRSRTIDSIVEEARQMVAAGVKEINLIGQDLTYFGVDTEGQLLLPKLIRALDQIPDIPWIRLFYAYPSFVTDELIETIAESEHVCHYLDMPLQHASDSMLKSMKRGITQEKTVKLVHKLRGAIPDLSLRTTFITGFPGETESDFLELLEFLKEMRFEKMGVFTYSDEPDAASYHLKTKVPSRVKKDRQERLMELQQKISLSANKALEGQTLEVLIDAPSSKEGIALGRTYRDAPDIDGKVFVKSSHQLKAGDVVSAKVARGLEYDLEAVLIGDGR